MAPAVNAPAAGPNPNPGPKTPRPPASAGAVTAVAPMVATVAKIASAFLMRVSSIECLRKITRTFFDGCSGPGFLARSREPTGGGTGPRFDRAKNLKEPERNRRLEIVLSSAATLKEVKA